MATFVQATLFPVRPIQYPVSGKTGNGLPTAAEILQKADRHECSVCTDFVGWGELWITPAGGAGMCERCARLTNVAYVEPRRGAL